VTREKSGLMMDSVTRVAMAREIGISDPVTPTTKWVYSCPFLHVARVNGNEVVCQKGSITAFIRSCLKEMI